MALREIINTCLQELDSCTALPTPLWERYGCSRVGALSRESLKSVNFPSSANIFLFHKICKKKKNQLSIWGRKAKRQPRTKHLELEYKALRISVCSRNAGKPLPMEQQFCVFYPSQLLCCSYQIHHIFTMIPARCLASSLQKRPSRRRTALLNIPSSSEEFVWICWPGPWGTSTQTFQIVTAPLLRPAKAHPLRLASPRQDISVPS